MAKPVRICFLADRHDLYDDRIYWKMAVPLVKKGFQVHYILIGTTASVGITAEGVAYKILKLKTYSKNRSLNFLLKRLNPDNNYRLMLKEAKTIRADIYHFHDLWINRIGPRLKQLSHHPAVFYDAREPYAEDYLSYVKTSFPWLLQLFASRLDRWEKKKSKNYDMVIANELGVQQKFAKVIGEERSTVLYNYTDLSLETTPLPDSDKKYDLIYCGAITEERGAFEIIKAVKFIKEEIPEIRVLFLGNYFPITLQDNMQDYIICNNLEGAIELMNAVPYHEVAQYYQLSKIGLVLLQRVKTFEISMPIKMFEYMAFGLPIVGSDFGHMKDLIKKNNCGIAVTPNNSKAIADAVVRILKDGQLYEKFSQNGRTVTQKEYRWEYEFKKLLDFYDRALNER